VKYLNQALTKVIQLFRETEQWDLVSLGINTTLTSYECTRVSPFNPFASACAKSIETLGIENGEVLVSYEILAKKGPPELSGDDKEVLHSAFLGELYDNMFNSNIVMLLNATATAKGSPVNKTTVPSRTQGTQD
jgi:hypothetical protein